MVNTPGGEAGISSVLDVVTFAGLISGAAAEQQAIDADCGTG